ncbi:Zinc finger protein [Plakobranchus ocellatus]|uniref:Zinc finger protein n=1 Tax=Plakobranchus ocellatus TaxID=259542 RepID=A0AAV4CC19_9GAST|nr:Zinc finger protein [Plakobranchus ocellatus]
MYSSIFSDRPGTASTEEHCIELTSSIPVRQRPYPVPYAMRQTLRDELRVVEDLGGHQEEFFPLRFSCGSRQEKEWYESYVHRLPTAE